MPILTLSLPAFYSITWVVFGRLLLDDYLVLIALLILTGTSTTAQSTVHQIYAINAVTTSHSHLPLDPDFLSNTSRAFGGALLPYLVALYTTKLSFLVFFRRLGGQLTEYMVIWWLVLALNVAFCVVSLAMHVVPHSCFFGSVEEALFSPKCGGTGSGREHGSGSRPNSLIFVAVCLLDVVLDSLVLGFPIVILCRVRVGIAVRKKVLLSVEVTHTEDYHASDNGTKVTTRLHKLRNTLLNTCKTLEEVEPAVTGRGAGALEYSSRPDIVGREWVMIRAEVGLEELQRWERTSSLHSA